MEKYFLICFLFGLYFIPVILAANIERIKILTDIPRKVQTNLILSSLGEWAGVIGSFILYGLIMGIDFHLFHVLILLCVANVVGLVSQVPGGLGGFDIIMLKGLVSLGIGSELAATWLIFYRFGSFIVPFIISTGILGLSLIKDRTFKYGEDISAFIGNVLAKLLSILVYAYGLLFIISLISPEDLQGLARISKLYQSVNYNIVNNFLSIGLGIGFVLVGRISLRKHKKSFKLLLALSLFTGLCLIFNGGGWYSLMPLLIFIGLGLLSKKDFYRDQFIYSWEDMTIDGLLISLVSLNSFFRYGSKFSLAGNLGIHGSSLVSFIYLAIFASILLGSIYLLLAYLKADESILLKEIDIGVFADFTRSYGNTFDAGLALTQDKYVYYYENDNKEKTVAFLYAVINSKVLVMGQPIGRDEDKERAIEDFISTCDRLNYNPVFYEIEDTTTLILHDYGYDFIKYGEGALVDLENFNLEGSKAKNYRQVRSRASRDGLSFEVIRGPYSKDLIRDLRAVSDKWLDDRGEKGYSLGFFKESYIQEFQLALIRDREARIIAFANILPLTGPDKMTIDLMRFDRDLSPNGTMDYMFIELLLYGKAQGVESFYLGVAPLSNVGLAKSSYLSEKLVHLVYKYGDKFYSFSGLRKYKEKYASKWIAKYVSYSPNNWLLYSFAALYIVDNKEVIG